MDAEDPMPPPRELRHALRFNDASGVTPPLMTASICIALPFQSSTTHDAVWPEPADWLDDAKPMVEGRFGAAFGAQPELALALPLVKGLVLWVEAVVLCSPTPPTTFQELPAEEAA